MSKYKIEIRQEVLKHLGINLYSNIYAVLSEIVANSYDADSTKVGIEINHDSILIEDDGTSMTVEEANLRFLTVGYAKRSSEGSVSQKFKRQFMGRKGIGKLSLFSIAQSIEVHCNKDGIRHGFCLNLDDLKESWVNNSPYFPKEIVENSVTKETPGVLIKLSKLTKSVPTYAVVKRKLSRRFGLEILKNFEISVNGEIITLDDRGYFNKIEYLWYFGDSSQIYADRCKIEPNAKNKLENRIEIGGSENSISGWIGTVKKAGDIQEENENLNRIVVLTRGKLAQENILDAIPEGGLYSKYLIGEINAEFLDVDQDGIEDISTSNRQAFFENDPRFVALRHFLSQQLKKIQTKWAELRTESGTREALKNKEIKGWYNSLDTLYQLQAKKMFGFINKLSLDSDSEKLHLYKYSIVAFESLKMTRQHLDIDENRDDIMPFFRQLFKSINDYAGIQHYLIIENRLEVIKKFEALVDSEAKERVLQNVLFENLWLIDPVGESISGAERLEMKIKSILDDRTNLSKDIIDSRADITFQSINEHYFVVELKKAGRTLKADELLMQILKYKAGVEEYLKNHARPDDVKIYIVMSEPPINYNSNTYRPMFEQANVTLITYDNLIIQAQTAYEQFLEIRKETDRLAKILASIDKPAE